jgi:hypothetical protein
MSNTAQGFVPYYGGSKLEDEVGINNYGGGGYGIKKADNYNNGVGAKGELSPIADRHSGYGGGGGGYGSDGYDEYSGSYGGYGGGGGYHGNDVSIRFRPNTNFDLGGNLQLKGPVNIRLPSIRLPPIRGLDAFNFRIPNLRLSSQLSVPTDIDICPDIILSVIIAAAAAAVYLFYTTITAGRRRRRRRRRADPPTSVSSFSYADDWESLFSAMWIGTVKISNSSLLALWSPFIPLIKKKQCTGANHI